MVKRSSEKDANYKADGRSSSILYGAYGVMFAKEITFFTALLLVRLAGSLIYS